jgi:hypothetical protein
MAETTGRKQRGKGKPFAKGRSGNPKGRPKGSGLSGQLREAIAANAPGIVKTLTNAALAGDVQAARVLLDRVLPALKAESLPVRIAGLDAGTLTQRAENALKAAGDGEVAPDTAASLIAAVAALTKIKEIDEIEARIKALEEKK